MTFPAPRPAARPLGQSGRPVYAESGFLQHPEEVVLPACSLFPGDRRGCMTASAHRRRSCSRRPAARIFPKLPYTPVPECLSCGACCFGRHDRYIALFPEDLSRGIPEHAVNRIEGRSYMRMQDGHCAQLTLTESGALACAIYEVRPSACRAFRAGSFECGRSRAHRLVEADAMRDRGIGPQVPVTPVGDVPDAAIIAEMSVGPKGRGRRR